MGLAFGKVFVEAWSKQRVRVKMKTPTKIKQAENGLGNAKGTPSESENKMDDIKRKLERVPQMRVKDEARPALRDALIEFE